MLYIFFVAVGGALYDITMGQGKEKKWSKEV